MQHLENTRLQDFFPPSPYFILLSVCSRLMVPEEERGQPRPLSGATSGSRVRGPQAGGGSGGPAPPHSRSTKTAESLPSLRLRWKKTKQTKNKQKKRSGAFSRLAKRSLSCEEPRGASLSRWRRPSESWRCLRS